MRAMRALVLATMLVFAVTASAAAQPESTLNSGVGASAPHVAVTLYGVRTTGYLSISFHGDRASGCSAHGWCGYSGTILWRPPAGDLLAETFRNRQGVRDEAYLNLGQGDAPISTRVTRVTASGRTGTCADLQAAGDLTDLIFSGRDVTFTLLGPDTAVLGSRCAGPLDPDVARFAPRRVLPRSRVMAGRLRIDLSGVRRFAAAGFAGTIRSTVVLFVGKPQPESSSGGFPPGTKLTRVRLVNEVLRVVSSQGMAIGRATGVEDRSICALLDSCGLSETLSWNPAPPVGTPGWLTAIGPATRPYRDFLAALGLSRRGDPRGIQTVGGLSSHSSHRLTARVVQDGFVCNDSAKTRLDGISFGSAADRLYADYYVGGEGRTRCPGPYVLNLNPELGTGSVPLRALGGRAFTLALSGASAFEDDGYVGHLHARLWLRLRRGTITQHFEEVPSGTSFFARDARLAVASHAER